MLKRLAILILVFSQTSTVDATRANITSTHANWAAITKGEVSTASAKETAATLALHPNIPKVTEDMGKGTVPLPSRASL